MATTDNLNIKINADATKASQAIDRICRNLNNLSTRLKADHFKTDGLNRVNTSLHNCLDNARLLNAEMVTLQGNLSRISNVSVKSVATASAQANTAVRNLNSNLNNLRTNLNGIKSNNIQRVARAASSANITAPSVNQVVGANSYSNALNQIKFVDSNLRTLFNSANRTHGMFTKMMLSMQSWARTWGTFYAAVYPFIRLLEKISDATKNAMNYVETYNYYTVAMQKIGNASADSYAEAYMKEIGRLDKKMSGFTLGSQGELLESNGKNIGLDPNMMMNYQARIGAITNSVGLLAETSVDAQKALSMLAADLSSLTNTDLETVMTNLTSGLIGMSRSLYKYGIDITNTTLQRYAEANSISKKVSAMSQEEKMQLRLLAILDQSQVAWTDQIQTIDTVDLVAA